MSTQANYIKQRLSLRQPLREALDILVHLSDELELSKEVDLKAELDKVKALYPSCADFERAFPSICFSIATGVGKTRLMGACIAYLNLEKGIKNFFVLAPNLTIYDKLIEDFGNPGNPKYVFSGISEYVHNRPVVITGDNYNQLGGLFKDTEVRINIFNIAKFNSDNKATKKDGQSLPPRIKRLSEYLGQSYWEYLSKLDDLVILMDEAHRYHADASKNAINELKPVLGIELTATPIDEKGLPFKNVVYEYSLAKALSDGKYVKNPAIATRKNFNASNLTDKEIEIIKLEDAISIHEDTKNELEIYARNNDSRKVKPFVLIVCRDINHAKDTYNYVSSHEFYDGAFSGKVLQIDSSTRNTDEIEQQFLTLEHEDNHIEIVIHVNMLKEGWDVTNLYTIVPLRAAKAAVLIEQTIGRGLRLPYNGERTGVDKIDKLTVVAHENFEAVIQAAQDPNSVLNKLTFVEISEEDLKNKTVVVTSQSRTEVSFREEEKKIAEIKDEGQKQKAINVLDAKKAIIDVIPSLNSIAGVTKISDLEKKEVKAKVIEKIKENLNQGQTNIFAASIVQEAEEIYNSVITSYKENIIEIPRMDLVQDEVTVWFEDFDLDLSKGFDFRVMDEEIMRVNLKGNEVDTIGVKQGAFTKETPANQIISELINFPEIDYDENADLLMKITSQAIDSLESKLDKKSKLPLLVRQFRKVIAGKIYDQMKEHFKIGEPEYINPKVLPFVKVEDWNFTTALNFGTKDYREIIKPDSIIPKYVFRGFLKACHFEYKFDSKTEKDFAFILEEDKTALKWMRPAANQFRIYWANNSKQYRPDFVVETADTIYLVETKSAADIESAEVADKKSAALKYCKYATEFTTANEGKPWSYLLIPHNEVQISSSFSHLASRFEQK
jgi:type III restriction enzyme